ncbi:MAG: dihydroneopterin aldolase [Actinomycetota bacterium]
MSDLIRIAGLRVMVRIGVSEEERTEPRPVAIDIDVHTDTSRAGKSDDLSDTVDYSAVISSITASVAGREIHLLEHLAAEIAELVLNTAFVERVAVEVSKESPPVEADVDSVAVRIERP